MNCFRDMMKENQGNLHSLGNVIKTVQVKQENCRNMRSIFDKIIALYKIKFEQEKKKKEANAITMFFITLFKPSTDSIYKIQETQTKEEIAKVLTQTWNYKSNNEDDSLGTVLGKSMFDHGRMCMHVSQLWVITNFLISSELYPTPQKLLQNVLTSLYDSSQVLFEMIELKERVTLVDVGLIDKENLFKDFIMFGLSSIIPDCENLLFKIFEFNVGEKELLVKEFVTFNLYIIKDQKAFAAAQSEDEQKNYWSNLLKDMEEAGSYLGLYIIDVVSKKLAGKIPVVGGLVNTLAVEPFNKFLLETTKKYFEGVKPKEIEELEFNLAAAFKGKTVDLTKMEGNLYDIVDRNLRCPHCQEHFFDLLENHYTGLNQQKFI